MFTIKQYIPNSFAGVKGKSQEFYTLDQLMSIDFVDAFKAAPEFYQFSINKNYTASEDVLLAEFENGDSWFVVGYISGNGVGLDLAVWDKEWE